MPRPWVLWTLLTAIAGCAGNRPSSEAAGSPADAVGQEARVVGRVTVVGNTPFEQVWVAPADTAGPGVEIVGPLKREIQAAGGAEVEIYGKVVARNKIEVERYTIRSVAGLAPLVGILESGEDQTTYLRIEDEKRRLRLEYVPEDLRAKAGAKVWVVLGEGRSVRAYGILREPGA